jgi:hypothetical protein
MAESAAPGMIELDNADVIQYMKTRMKALRVERQNLAMATGADPADFSSHGD